MGGPRSVKDLPGCTRIAGGFLLCLGVTMALLLVNMVQFVDVPGVARCALKLSRRIVFYRFIELCVITSPLLAES